MDRFHPTKGNSPYGYGSQINQAVAQDSDGDDIDLRAILGTAWRGRWIIIGCIALFGVLGFLFTTQQPSLYRASAKVLFEPPQANVDAGENIVRGILETNGLQNQIEILRSTSLIRRVIDNLNLDQNPVFNSSLRPEVQSWQDRLDIPPEVTNFLLDIGAIEPEPLPLDPVSQAARTEREVVQNVLRGLILRPVEGSQVIEILYTSGSPDLSSTIVNEVAKQYIVDQLEGKLETFQSATGWLTDRVAELQLRVEASEAEVLEAQAKLAEKAGASLEVLSSQLETLRAARAEARGAAAELRGTYTRLRDALTNGTDVASLSGLRSAQGIEALRTRKEALQAEDDTLANTLRPSHPIRERIINDIEDIDSQIEAESQRILETLRLDMSAAEEREAQLAREMQQIEEQSLILSTESIEVRNLEREAQASRTLYEELLSRLEESNAQEDLQTADARILTPAEPPLRPLQTTKQRTIQIALVVGAAFGVGLVFLLDRLNNTFRGPHQLEEMSGEAVLATIPMAGSRMKRYDVLKVLRQKPNSSLAEAIRNLRTSILFSNMDKPPQVVMFSSSIPREGKSTTSMLTALTSRQMGKSAIIVDCDLRMPAISKVMDINKSPRGLLSLLNGTATLEEAVHVEKDSGLHVLMTRASERAAKINAADVLASAKFRDLIHKLRQEYELIILDTPPTLVVTDARIISELADSVVFCVRWDQTPRSAVLEGLKELRTVGAHITGVVLTLVNERRAAKYSYDGYSYYRGRYRDYYEN